MDAVTLIAALIFAGFAVRTIQLLLREDSQKDLLLTTGLWGLALLVWGLYLITERGSEVSTEAVIGLAILTFALSFYGLFQLREEKPEEFEKEL
jgi:hypothetical protein